MSSLSLIRRNKGIGIVSTGGVGKNRYPIGTKSSLANRSNCLRVGLSKPSTHSFTLGCCSRYAQQSLPERSIAQARMDLSMFNLTRLITITYIFTPANIRLSFENAKRFLEYFLRLPQISQINTDFLDLFGLR